MKSILIAGTGKVHNLLVSEMPFLALKVGDIVKARVLEVSSNEDVVIRLNNRVIEAKSKIPLQPGEELLLKVEGEGNEVRFRLVGAPQTKGSDAIRKLILSTLTNMQGSRLNTEELMSLKEIIGKIPRTLNEKLPELLILKKFLLSIESLTGSAIKENITSSGIFFEAKIRAFLLKLFAKDLLEGDGTEQFGELSNKLSRKKGIEQAFTGDLKGAILKLKSALKNTMFIDQLLQNNTKPDELDALLDKLVRNIKYYQLQSKLDDTLQTFLPLFWKNLKEGELIFKRRKRGPSGEEAYSCVIDLEHIKIGKIKTFIIMQKGCIYLTLVSDNSNFFSLLRSNSKLLEEQFDTAGLKLGSLIIRHDSDVESVQTFTDGLDVRV